MKDQIANKIKRLELENFTCFSKAAFDFSPGINVLIGENGTGKTHVLKVLYALKTLGRGTFSFPSESIEDEEIQMDLHFEEVFESVFKVPNLANLVRQQPMGDKLTIKKEIWQEQNIANGNLRRPISIRLNQYLFIPVFEILSWFNGFIAAYLNRESSLDETYFDLAKALDLLPLKGESLENQKPLVKQIEDALRVRVIREGNDFILVSQDNLNKTAASISASGINKLAQFIQLIQNGSLTKDTILFWDEPEANLNPKYITLVAKFLQTLANAGCQIFVASHDYLLVHELSLLSEYREEKEMNGETVPDIKFFALYKGEDGSTQVEEGQSMSEIQNDAIGEEYAAHHNREEALWRKPYEKTSL